MKKLQLTIDLEHASLLMTALEAIARFGIMQLDVAFDMFNNHHRNVKPEVFNRDTISHLEKIIKDIIENAGVKTYYDSLRPKETIVAWDAYQYVRRELAWHNDGFDWRTASPEQKSDRCWKGVMWDNPLNQSSANLECKIVEE